LKRLAVFKGPIGEIGFLKPQWIVSTPDLTNLTTTFLTSGNLFGILWAAVARK
jgi:hypothetical protein